MYYVFSSYYTKFLNKYLLSISLLCKFRIMGSIWCIVVRKNILLVILLFSIISLSPLYVQPSKAIDQYYEPYRLVVFYDDFSDENETFKRFDTTSQVIDSGILNDTGVAVFDGILIFYGDSYGSSEDKPIIITKGYCEKDYSGGSSYYNYTWISMPFNYNVSLSFMFTYPSNEYFYVYPRYTLDGNKYFLGVEQGSDTIVIGKIVDNVTTVLLNESIGYSILDNEWYNLTVSVSWEPVNQYGLHINHLVIELYSSQGVTSYDAYDYELSPYTYNALGFQGGSRYSKFQVFIDNITVTADMYKLGVEPVEDLAPGHADIDEVYVLSNDMDIFFYLKLHDTFTGAKNITEYALLVDVDKDSRLQKEYTPDYMLYIYVDEYNIYSSAVFDLESYNVTRGIHIVDGGLNRDYLVIEVNTSVLRGLSDSFYFYGWVSYSGMLIDMFPRDNVYYNRLGDYYIYYTSSPVPDIAWITVLDDIGDAPIDYLDIYSVEYGVSNGYLYFRINTTGIVPDYGGLSTGSLMIYIDADKNSSTGYSVNGLGAEYMINYTIGYIPRLYYYDGVAWNELYKEEYIKDPANTTSIILMTPINDYVDPELNLTFTATAASYVNNNTLVDASNTVVVPIPENPLYIVLTIAIILLITMYKRLRTFIKK